MIDKDRALKNLYKLRFETMYFERFWVFLRYWDVSYYASEKNGFTEVLVWLSYSEKACLNVYTKITNMPYEIDIVKDPEASCCIS